MRADLRRRTIALVVAYAVALQALLPSMALAVGAGADPLFSTELCASAVPSGSDPADKQGNACAHGIACLVSGCAGMAATLTRGLAPFELATAEHRPAIFLLPVVLPQQRTTLPHFARPPPFV